MSAFSGNATAEFVRRFWPDDDGPKHEKLCRAFAYAISQGYCGPGARLPTDAELTLLSDQLGVSRRDLEAFVEAWTRSGRRH